MTNKFKTKTKFLLPISMLVLALLMVTTSLITTHYSKVNSLKNLQKSVILATKISQLIHETQKERGYSSGYITSKGVKFRSELIAQRIKTKHKIVLLKNFLSTLDNDSILIYIKKPLHQLLALQNLQTKVDNRTISSTEIIHFYSNINDKFLDIIIELSKLSKIAQITQNIIAYSSFLYTKENAGMERALGTAILSQNIFKKGQRVYFTNLISAQKIYLKTFLKFVSKDADIFYKQTFSGEDIDNVQYIRNVILSINRHFNINPNFWFQNITSKINKLKLIDRYLEKEILININKELDKSYKLLLFFLLLNFVGIIIFVGVVTIILRLIHSERKLKQINDRYIISSVTDLKGRIIEASDAFCTMSEYTREELIGKPHNMLRHPDMPKSVFKELWSAIKQGKNWQGKVKNLKKNGGYYWVYANIEPVFDKNGKIEAYAAIRLDITDSIELQEELSRGRKKDKAMLQQSKLAQMGEMIAMIAHQWRQPLTAISSTASDLYMKIEFDNYSDKYFSNKLEKIDDLSQHLSKTIDDFRGFYKEDKERVNIISSEIIKGAIGIVSTSLESKNIILNTDFKCQNKINTYPNELRQVILNLIKNAEDILVEKEILYPTIKIKTYNDTVDSYLEIIDNGGGIPNDIIEKIFDPYFSTKTKKDGTGLGLYMSKTIVEKHCSGKLEVYNNKEGAVFKITIPIAEGI